MGTQLLFQDMLVNSSVLRQDEDRLCRQNQKMLRFFCWCRRKNRLVTTSDLMKFGCQYQSRLYDLRRHCIPRGYCIDLVVRWKSGVCGYRLVGLDESTWFRDARRKGKL